MEYLAHVETTKQLQLLNPRIRYPDIDKRSYPLSWPAQAASIERGRLILPMGCGRQSLLFQVDAPESLGDCKLVWSMAMSCTPRFSLRLQCTPQARLTPPLIQGISTRHL